MSVPAHPAATVVLLRDREQGCEVLLVRRNAQLAFHGGAWVFPGGRIDAEDYGGAGDPHDIVSAARHAAVREAFEEAGVTVSADELVAFSRWITPVEAPKRFDAWFFAARARTDVVQVDGGEIHEHRWLRPSVALAAQRRGDLDLPPPTFVTLHQLTQYSHTADVLAAMTRQGIEEFVPQLRVSPDGPCTLYAGDAAYDGDEVDRPGPRHRLWILEGGWRYERS